MDRQQQLAGCSTGLARLLVNYKRFMMSFWAQSDSHGACIQEQPGHIPPAPLGRYLARSSCYSGSIRESKPCSQPVTCVFAWRGKRVLILNPNTV